MDFQVECKPAVAWADDARGVCKVNGFFRNVQQVSHRDWP